MLNILFSNPLLFISYIFSLLVAVTIHEFSHAKTADYLGDPTPRLQGRLSFNPLAHIDLYGLMFLLLVGFGWGKPVVFDPYNLKNPRKEAGIISIAGPISNFILAIVSSILLYLFIFLKLNILIVIGSFILIPMINLNIILGVFNLLPINPLDGFKIVGAILPEDKSHEWYGLERFGMIFLIVLIIPFGNSSMLDMIIRPIVSFLSSFLIPSLRSTGVI